MHCIYLVFAGVARPQEGFVPLTRIQSCHVAMETFPVARFRKRPCCLWCHQPMELSKTRLHATPLVSPSPVCMNHSRKCSQSCALSTPTPSPISIPMHVAASREAVPSAPLIADPPAGDGCYCTRLERMEHRLIVHVKLALLCSASVIVLLNLDSIKTQNCNGRIGHEGKSNISF